MLVVSFLRLSTLQSAAQRCRVLCTLLSNRVSGANTALAFLELLIPRSSRCYTTCPNSCQTDCSAWGLRSAARSAQTSLGTWPARLGAGVLRMEHRKQAAYGAALCIHAHAGLRGGRSGACPGQVGTAARGKGLKQGLDVYCVLILSSLCSISLHSTVVHGFSPLVTFLWGHKKLDAQVGNLLRDGPGE